MTGAEMVYRSKSTGEAGHGIEGPTCIHVRLQQQGLWGKSPFSIHYLRYWVDVEAIVTAESCLKPQSGYSGVVSTWSKLSQQCVRLQV